MSKLTVVKIKALKAEAGRRATAGKDTTSRVGDGGGLWLQLRSDSRSSWLFRYTMGGRARVMGLGSERDVTLAEAREAAREARRLILKGIDPLAAKADQATAVRAKAGGGRTFRDVATEYITAHKEGWRNPKHALQWEQTLAAHAYGKLGSKPVSAITTDDVLEVLTPIWSKTPETASRLRGRIEAILGAAIARGFRPGPNPADWKTALKPRLAPVAKLKRAAGSRNHPSLRWQDAPAFMKALEAEEGLAAKALQFTILTAARSGETRGMTWGEIDLEAGTWIIPAGRMKAARIHRQPLSADAVALLRSISRRSADSASLVFPGQAKRDGKEAPLSDMALSMTLRRMNARAGGPFWLDQLGAPVVVHGFRSTFRVWVSEATRYPAEVGEAQLAHVLKDKTQAAYARSDHLDKRRELMGEWARFISGGDAVAERTIET